MADSRAEIHDFPHSQWREQLHSNKFASLQHTSKLYIFYFSCFLGLLSELRCTVCLVFHHHLLLQVRAGEGSESWSPRAGLSKDRLERPRCKPLCYGDIAAFSHDLFWALIIPFHQKGKNNGFLLSFCT